MSDSKNPPLLDTTSNSELEEIRALDTIQRNIWARINDEVNSRGIKLSTGDAYALGSVIKEVLHPEVQNLIAQEANKAQQQLLTELMEHAKMFYLLNDDVTKYDAVPLSVLEQKLKEIG